MTVEERLAKIEGTVSQMDKRLNHFGEDIKEIRRDIKTNFKWTLGILIPMWVTIIGSIIYIAK